MLSYDVLRSFVLYATTHITILERDIVYRVHSMRIVQSLSLLKYYVFAHVTARNIYADIDMLTCHSNFRTSHILLK